MTELPVGLKGLRYPITQISLAVRDLDSTMDLYYQAFGWAPWQVFDHVPPHHKNTELRGEAVNYSLRGVEVYVGSLNFELLQPLEGPNLWSEFMDRRGEGIASIATMFKEHADGNAMKDAFKETFDIDVSMKANIGDHIEYYYLDTEETFGCLIESGSGHAIDFVKPVKVHPFPGAESGPSPISGIEYPITQISITVRDLEAKMKAYHTAFGWGPWKIYEADGKTLMHHCEMRGEPADFRVRWAETIVGDLNFELIEPLGGANPWQEFLDTKGQGISSIAVMFKTTEESERVKAQFAGQGIGISAKGHIGDDIEWYFLDTELPFKCIIESGSGHAFDGELPYTTYP